jgi:hypothetical protein
MQPAGHARREHNSRCRPRERGTDTPRPIDKAMGSTAFATISGGGYGSPRSRGRRVDGAFVPSQQMTRFFIDAAPIGYSLKFNHRRARWLSAFGGIVTGRVVPRNSHYEFEVRHP